MPFLRFPSASSRDRLGKPLSVAANGLLLLLPLAIFWRRDFFFLFDDWTELVGMTQSGFFHYILTPNGEIWFPLFRSVFYGTVHLVGGNYGVYITLNALLLGCDAILFARLLRRSLSPGLGLFLAILCILSSANAVVVWNAFYLCYLLCLFFFLLAWLGTNAYLDAPSRRKLVGIAACCLASVLSHPATLLALLVLPAYAWLTEPKALRAKVLPLALAAASALTLYTALYFLKNSVAIVSVAASSSPAAFILGNYLLHCFFAAFLSPLTQLNFQPDPAYLRSIAWITAGVVTGLALFTIWFGTPRERALGLGGLLFNILVFALVSLGRHQLSLTEALSPRYGFFADIGLLLLYGAFWNMLLRGKLDPIVSILLPLGFVGYLYFHTTFAFAAMDGQYTHWSRASRLSYQGYAALAKSFTAQEAAAALLYPQLRTFTQGQAAALGKLLGE